MKAKTSHMKDENTPATLEQIEEMLRLIDREDNIRFYNGKDWMDFLAMVSREPLTYATMESALFSLRVQIG